MHAIIPRTKSKR